MTSYINVNKDEGLLHLLLPAVNGTFGALRVHKTSIYVTFISDTGYDIHLYKYKLPAKYDDVPLLQVDIVLTRVMSKLVDCCNE